MYYREYKIYSGDLDTYNRWLKLYNLKHSDRSYELFVLDSFIEYVKHQRPTFYNLNHGFLIAFNNKVKRLQIFNAEKINECLDRNVAFLDYSERDIFLNQKKKI